MNCRVKYVTGPLTPEGAALVQRWKGFAVKLADRFLRRSRHLAAHKDDVISEAFCGLVEAARRWKPEKGTFPTYARWWVRQRMLEYDRRGARVVPLAATQRWTMPTDKSFDAPGLRKFEHDDGRGESSMHDWFALTDDAMTPDEAIDARALYVAAREQLARRLAGVDADSPKHLARGRRKADFYLRNTFEGATLDSISQEYGITREAVRQQVLRVEATFGRWAEDVRRDAA